MDKNLKYALQVGFKSPEPKKKKEFLSKLNAPKSTYSDFVFSQIGYIRKRVWFLSAVITVLIIFFMFGKGLSPVGGDSDSLIWIFAALIPFMALLTITELSRSVSYAMAELELSCRYSLPHIVMARAAILGISNLLLLFILVLAVGTQTECPIPTIMLYILVPYLLTCGASIFALNHINGMESTYCCAVIACTVSGGECIVSFTMKFLFMEEFIWLWGIVGLFSLLLLMMQGKKIMKTMEEFKWNLLSIN